MSKIVGIAVFTVHLIYGFMCLLQDNFIVMAECLAGAMLVVAPCWLDRKFKLDFPKILFTIFYIFLFCAIFLGSGMHFYSLIPFWDDILHGLSGALLAALGFYIVKICCPKAHPLFMGVFAFSFALAVGGLWEIYEYVGDGILNMNMQNYKGGDLQYVGRFALYDTMKDIIVDATSALLTSLAGGFALSKRRKNDQ